MGVSNPADPGTYCYGSDPLAELFQVHVGHNTSNARPGPVDVGGPTLWIRHAKSRLTEPFGLSADGDDERWVAEHYGYRTLDPPVTHRRTVEFHGKQRLIEITDEIDSVGHPPVRLAFHLGPTVEAKLGRLHPYSALAGPGMAARRRPG